MGGRGANSGIKKSSMKLDSIPALGDLTKNLPELKGSPKQIAWANDIRQRYVKRAQDMEKIYHKQINDGTITRNEKDYLSGLDSSLGFDRLITGERFSMFSRKATIKEANDEKAVAETRDYIGKKYNHKIGFDYFGKNGVKLTKKLPEKQRSRISEEYKKVKAIKKFGWRAKEIRELFNNNEAKYWIEHRR